MVRHKARWLLLKIEFVKDLMTKSDIASDNTTSITTEVDYDAANMISSKDISLAIRDLVSSAFGIAGIGIIEGLQVRLYDPLAQLAILKVSREACSMTRAAITMMTFIKTIPVVVSTFSVNGCVRTAKLSALYHVQKVYDSKTRHLGMNTALLQDEMNQQRYQDLQRQKGKIMQLE